MNDKQLQKELERRNRLLQLEHLEANASRAQSLTVGTAGGGTVEITMRSASGKFLWNTYQPVEVIEFINQLAAGIGCHIQIVPRKDFASWRDWQMSPEELAHAKGIQNSQAIGYAPFPKFPSNKYVETGANLPDPENQPGKIKREETKDVATKKTVNKRSTKRSRATSH